MSHGKLLIGREPDCPLRPDSPLISRHHCVLLLDDYTLRIRDLGSKNGTFLNSRRVGRSETILSHGDIVSVGEMVCQISLILATTAVEPSLPGAQPTASPSSMEGTGNFEGDTVQGDGPDVVSLSAPLASKPVVRSDLPTSPTDPGRPCERPLGKQHAGGGISAGPRLLNTPRIRRVFLRAEWRHFRVQRIRNLETPWACPRR